MLKFRKINIFKKYNRFYINKKSKKFKKIKNKTFFFKKYTDILLNSFLLKKKNYFFFYIFNKIFFFKFLNLNIRFFLKKNKKKKYKSIFSIFKYFFLKLKFYGKTFKWIFTKKKIRFKVQKAHKTFILFKHLRFKKKRKFKFKLRVFLIFDKKNMINCIRKIKYVNIFTKKGLRILKTFFFKKKGKISTYM